MTVAKALVAVAGVVARDRMRAAEGSFTMAGGMIGMRKERQWERIDKRGGETWKSWCNTGRIPNQPLEISDQVT